MPDLTLKCVDCGEGFILTERDQKFFAEMKDPKTGKPFVPPRRCKACRQKRKAQRSAPAQTQPVETFPMVEFKPQLMTGNREDPSPDRRRRRSFRDDRRRRFDDEY